MKKIKYLMFLVFIFFLTGCSEYDMSMKINKDKSMNFTVLVLSDSKDDKISENISLFKDKLEDYNYQVSEYDSDGKYGIKIYKYFDNIDDISLGNREDEFDLLYFYNNDYDSSFEKKMFNLDKGFDTNRYAANFYVDLSSLDINLDNATVTFYVEVPNGTVSNNANLVSYEGNKLTWNITSSGKTEIDFVFEIKSYDYIYYGIAVLVVIFLILSIISSLFSRSGDASSNDSTGSVSRQLSNANYDVEKKIENITRNAILNSNYKSNKTVNMNNVKSSNTNTASVNMDNKFNTQIKTNENNKVSEDDMTGFKTPIKEKKNIFGFINKKNDKKEVNSSQNNDESSRKFDNFNQNQNNNSNINVNSQSILVSRGENEVDIPNPFGNLNNNLNSVNNQSADLNNGNFGFKYENEMKTNNTNVNIINNPNLDVNYNSSRDPLDSFEYKEENKVNNEELSKTDEVNVQDGLVINVNNRATIVNKTKKEE